MYLFEKNKKKYQIKPQHVPTIKIEKQIEFCVSCYNMNFLLFTFFPTNFYYY